MLPLRTVWFRAVCISHELAGLASTSRFPARGHQSSSEVHHGSVNISDHEGSYQLQGLHNRASTLQSFPHARRRPAAPYSQPSAPPRGPHHRSLAATAAAASSLVAPVPDGKQHTSPLAQGSERRCMLSTEARRGGGFVTAPLKYLRDASKVPKYEASMGGGDSTVHEGDYLMQPVDIHDGRGLRGTQHLDREGFILLDQATSMTDFYNDDEVKRVYLPEVQELVRQATGAAAVQVFDYTRRAASLTVQRERNIREPASIVHNDYTASSAPARLRDHYLGAGEGAADVEALLARRFAIVNVWRSIAGAVVNAPMAMCDARSVAAGELVSVTRHARDRIGELQQAVHSPAHRWFYFPHMQPSEALLFKTYDSEVDGRSRFTIHTAFDDPTAPADAPARESIETRCFVFF